MNRLLQILGLLLIFVSSSASAQILFKPAYYINNSGEKIQCLIKDVEWKSNPTSFEYKITEDTSIQIAKIENVQEFQIENYPKYIRKTVKMDRWDVFSPVTEERESIYKTETLLLKEVVKGAANLYAYADGSLTTYFYEVNEQPIRQLIRKNYITIDAIGNKRSFTNNMFKRQLYGDLKCEGITENQAKNVNYFEGDFVRFFDKYNSCMGISTEVAESGKTKIHLTPRLGFVQNSLDVSYQTNSDYNYNFGNKSQVRIGLEAEVVLPFNRYKWALLVEPVYTAFKAEGDGTIYTDNIDYKAIDFQLALRHYMFLNNDSQIFVNAGVVYPLKINDVLYAPARQSLQLELKAQSQILLGAGYRFKKISAEVRYLGNQNLMASLDVWEAKYTSLAFVLGYQIF